MPALGTVLDSITARVRATRPDEARLQCEWLTSHVLDCARLELPMRLNQNIAESQVRQIESGATRLAGGEPLQYVLGEAEFMGRVFICDRRALIPRPETEQLTAWMLADTTLWQNKAPIIAEAGTGSGCIVITLALERPTGVYLATDTSTAALALARANAVRHGIGTQIRFVACDLLSAAAPASLTAVISNPPYVSAADWTRLDRNVRDFEPRAALMGGPDGLASIRRLIKQAWRALKPGGVLFLEIGENQGGAVLGMTHTAGFHESKLRPDLAGKDRMVRAVKSRL